MKTRDIRRWVDKAGVDAVAKLCGVGIDTIGRWTAGGQIPRTRIEAVRRIYDDWKSEQVRA